MVKDAQSQTRGRCLYRNSEFKNAKANHEGCRHILSAFLKSVAADTLFLRLPVVKRVSGMLVEMIYGGIV